MHCEGLTNRLGICLLENLYVLGVMYMVENGKYGHEHVYEDMRSRSQHLVAPVGRGHSSGHI